MSKLSAGSVGIVALGLVAAPMAIFATGCSTTQSATAATVNGEAIPEQEITDYIQNFRQANGLEGDEEWAQWMVDNGRDAESIREDAIDYYIRLAVIDQDAKEKGIEVTDEEVDNQLVEIKDYYGYNDEEFNNQLAAIGYTYDSYKEYVRQSLIQEKLMEAVSSTDEVDPADVLSQANAYITILDGAKDIQVIAVSSEEEAQDAKSKLDSGTDFAEVQTEVGSPTDYDGWDVMTGLDTSVTDALDGMNDGDVSGVIAGDDGATFYIVKVNQVLHVSEDGFATVDEVPETLREEFEATVSQSAASSDFETYVQGLVDGAEKTINPMPSGLPYDVSTEGIEPSGSDSETDFTTDVVTDEDITAEGIDETVDVEDVDPVDETDDNVTVVEGEDSSTVVSVTPN